MSKMAVSVVSFSDLMLRFLMWKKDWGPSISVLSVASSSSFLRAVFIISHISIWVAWRMRYVLGFFRVSL